MLFPQPLQLVTHGKLMLPVTTFGKVMVPHLPNLVLLLTIMGLMMGSGGKVMLPIAAKIWVNSHEACPGPGVERLR